MIPGKVLTILAVLWCLGFAECARQTLSRMITIDQSSNNTDVSVAVGEQVEIALRENPTTGFRWELKMDGAPACVPRGSTYEAPAAGVGRAGTRRWRFEAVQAGSGVIELVYRRSFEADKPPAEVFHLAVNVGK